VTNGTSIWSDLVINHLHLIEMDNNSSIRVLQFTAKQTINECH